MPYNKDYDFELLTKVIFPEQHDKPIDWPAFFGNQNPLILEAGCGNGHFLINKANANLNHNFIGIDLKKKRIIRCREKEEKHQLKNVAWICGEALQALIVLFPNNIINEIYMPFPDPWPKRKHHKHRLLQENFINVMYEKLKVKGSFCFITDDQDYYQAGCKLVDNDVRFTFNKRQEDPASELTQSIFGEKWKKENRLFYSILLIKK